VFAGSDGGASGGYFARLIAATGLSLAQLVRTPSHSRRAEAARRLARRSLWLAAGGAVVIIAMMFMFDVNEIELMPPRGTPSLWPVRILTDFGKDWYVLWLLGALMLIVILLAPRVHGMSRGAWVSLGTRLQFLFMALVVPLIAGDALKYVVGRGRPFVGGKANAFNFSHFAGTEAYASLPSAHAITAVALAFAVSALWPRTRLVMILYALMIIASRLVLLAHHPSDVVAGALIGILGAMVVRYWFAARHLVFTIRPDGTIVALPGPTPGHLKRVAREAFAP
jgi:membrane-associated phospholipid phosphatase